MDDVVNAAKRHRAIAGQCVECGDTGVDGPVCAKDSCWHWWLTETPQARMYWKGVRLLEWVK